MAKIYDLDMEQKENLSKSRFFSNSNDLLLVSGCYTTKTLGSTYGLVMRRFNDNQIIINQTNFSDIICNPMVSSIANLFAIKDTCEYLYNNKYKFKFIDNIHIMNPDALAMFELNEHLNNAGFKSTNYANAFIGGEKLTHKIFDRISFLLDFFKDRNIYFYQLSNKRESWFQTQSMFERVNNITITEEESMMFSKIGWMMVEAAKLNMQITNTLDLTGDQKRKNYKI